MDLKEFVKNYGTEEQCRAYLFKVRWSKGFKCPKCGYGDCFNIRSRNLYQCKSCGHQASVTAGTIMDKSKTPLVKWFKAFYLMSDRKHRISARSLKEKIDVAYQTAWSMCHKIRHAMGGGSKRLFKLDDIIELNGFNYSSPNGSGKSKHSTQKPVILISVSHRNPDFVKMKVVGSYEGKTVDDETVKLFAEETIAKGSKILTNSTIISNILAENGYTLKLEKDESKLPNPRKIYSDFQDFIRIFHGVDSMHLQRYLNHYCYRYIPNWDKANVFLILVSNCVITKITYNELIGDKKTCKTIGDNRVVL